MNKPLQCFLAAVLCLQAVAIRADVDAVELDWLEGRWCSSAGGEDVEEYWMASAGGAMLGVSRTIKKDRMTGFEFMRIASVDGILTLLAQPGGSPATAFARTDGGASWIRFENPRHDFPRRVEYHRRGDSLHAEIAGPGDDGKTQVIGFDYRRCDG